MNIHIQALAVCSLVGCTAAVDERSRQVDRLFMNEITPLRHD